MFPDPGVWCSLYLMTLFILMDKSRLSNTMNLYSREEVLLLALLQSSFYAESQLRACSEEEQNKPTFPSGGEGTGHLERGKAEAAGQHKSPCCLGSCCSQQ